MTTSATPRGLLFGTAAESYERFRLGYPDEVVDRTLSYAARPIATALEVGAGTGKATRAFASRGVKVTALEPDPAMFAVLERETLAMPVTPVLSAFEAYDGRPADLVYGASSFHWTDPHTRWTRAAGLLVDGGVLAAFGSQVRIAEPALQDAVADAVDGLVDDSAFAPHRPEARDAGRRGDQEIEDSGVFGDVEDHVIARQTVLPQKEYVGHLSTLSAYLRLPSLDRQEVLRRVAQVVPDQVRVDAPIRMFLARRR